MQTKEDLGNQSLVSNGTVTVKNKNSVTRSNTRWILHPFITDANSNLHDLKPRTTEKNLATKAQ